MDRLNHGINRAKNYIHGNTNGNAHHNKPIVIEEFGLARDGVSYDPKSPTTIKDEYFKKIFEIVYEFASQNETMSGINYWAYGGKGRPRNSGGEYWVPGDDLIGDPPHERQGWYTVYDKDTSTKEVIKEYADKLEALCIEG